MFFPVRRLLDTYIKGLLHLLIRCILLGILTGLPYGVLADHIGRRPVLVLAVLGASLGEIWPRIVCMFSPGDPR